MFVDRGLRLWVQRVGMGMKKGMILVFLEIWVLRCGDSPNLVKASK